MSLPERIVLVGPSGSGKSTVAGRVAALTGYDIWDTDARIVARIGMPITAFFQRFGESAFRALEREVVAEACAGERRIVAAGGGAILSAANWAAMRPGSAIVGLTAPPSVLVARVREQAERVGDEAERPLLTGDAEARMVALLDVRRDFYAAADVTLDTSGSDIDAIARAIVDAATEAVGRGMVPRLSLDTPLGRSDIYVSPGARGLVAELVRRRWPRARRVWIVTDEHVAPSWGAAVERCCAESGFGSTMVVVRPGEQSKSFQTVEQVCRRMTDEGATRRDVVVAVGGGVVGDLAGFVASVCLRGLALVQVPTSLLAMVDSSVGGKTGVNLPAGKNLAGAFYQAGLVVIDPDVLESLPSAEYRSGMAEIIKHAIIQQATPLGGNTLRQRLERLPLDPLPTGVLTDILALNVAIKLSVVQADERESGLRMLLNFGHTAGHAIEADGYRYRHGEAVGVGMLVASRIAQALGRVGPDFVATVAGLLERAGLPTSFDGEVDAVIGRLARDKKNVDGALHWILPDADGRVEVVTGVPTAVVLNALKAAQRED